MGPQATEWQKREAPVHFVTSYQLCAIHDTYVDDMYIRTYVCIHICMYTHMYSTSEHLEHFVRCMYVRTFTNRCRAGMIVAF